jgi:hypothetical protein
MKTIQLAAAAAAGALAMLAAVPASAAVTYYLDDYAAGFSPPLGTVTVDGLGSNVLSFDVSLADNVFFQMSGNGSLHDAFWFNLTGLAGGNSVTYNISAPNAPGGAAGGDYPTGGLFTGANFSNNAYGQGFLQNADYAIQVKDTSAGSNLDYYTGHLTFTVTGGVGSTLGLAGINGTDDVAGADLRECSTSACTTILATGPVGATFSVIPQGGVPEPATWAMMIIGFGGVGALIRRRRSETAATFA